VTHSPEGKASGMIDTRRTLGRSWLLLLLAVALTGCAPKQRIPLEVGPGPVTLYVDGQQLEALPAEVELRADKGHVLFFRAEGYRSERVLLFARERDGRPHLEPAQVKLKMVPAVAGTRSFEIQSEEP
jgi:hypothetical protein